MKLIHLAAALVFGLCLLSCTAYAQDAKPAAPAQDPAATTPETAAADETQPSRPRLRVATDRGDFTIEVFPDKAPRTVENFLAYVDDGFYANTVFHRVIPEFMIQGGGFTEDLTQKPTRSPVPNEADNGLVNTRGTLAIARTNNPHSATAQFFVNVIDNHYLNHRSKSVQGWGYTVFGEVVEGMDVVDAISKTPTRVQGPMQNLPVDPVVIESITRIDG
jgi:cyclophilin family peptidyl-prolyl cis-trans isomerase